MAQNVVLFIRLLSRSRENRDSIQLLPTSHACLRRVLPALTSLLIHKHGLSERIRTTSRCRGEERCWLSSWLGYLRRLLREGVCSCGLGLQWLLLLEACLHSVLLRCLSSKGIAGLTPLRLSRLLWLHKTVHLTSGHH